MKQSTALKILLEGRNCFITGSPGAGKTYLLNQFIEELHKKSVTSAPINVARTASTGISATHIDGQTIHRFAGIGIGNKTVSEIVESSTFKNFCAPAIRRCDVLIIDEVSMLSKATLERVDEVFRAARKRTGHKPFGVCQVVLCGDFFQLPPISHHDEPAQFAFESETWQRADFHVCYLTEQHRQSDTKYNEILEAIRFGSITEEQRNFLQNTVIDPAEYDEFDCQTHLYSHNVKVDAHNKKELDKIDSSPMVFHMKTDGNPANVETLKRGCLASEELVLKKGAIVMALKNDLEDNFANGSTGIVTDFKQAINDEGAKVGPMLPFVEFDNGNSLLVAPMSWKMFDDQGEMLAMLTQIPLTLAWAVTIHKSQGMTLDRAIIDLSRTFELGMGYVALSRLRSIDGLYLLGLNARSLQVSEKVSDVDKKFRAQSGMLEDLYQ